MNKIEIKMTVTDVFERNLKKISQRRTTTKCPISNTSNIIRKNNTTNETSKKPSNVETFEGSVY